MTLRRIPALLLLLLALPLAGCTTVLTLVVTPTTGQQTLTAIGQTAQYTAMDTSQTGSSPSSPANVTTSVKWSVSNSSVATISASGLATAVGYGNTSIIASSGGVVAMSDLTVTGPVPTIAILPGIGIQSVTSPGQTVQFKAIASSQVGTEPPVLTDVTNSVTWSAASPSIATIDSTGLATSTGVGKTTITAQQGGVIASSDLTVTGSTVIPQALAIIPAKGVQTLGAVGQTAQFRAIASTQVGNAPVTTQDVTNSATWIPADVFIATMNSSGLATSTGFGTTAITAEYNGVISIPSDLTIVPLPNVPPVLSVIPSASQAVATNVGETTQFIAIGSLSGLGANQNLTDLVTWVSSDVEVATINQAGLATAVSASAASTTITAYALSSTGNVISATSTLSVPLGGTLNLTSLALYEVGAGIGSVTSSPAGINCGPDGTHAACTGVFPAGTTVILTETPASGSFGGWSTNCTSAVSTPNQCSIVMGTATSGSNETVGAVFNTP